MSPVPLEFIKDEFLHPQRLSRILPATLYSYVTETSYIEFCNKIDALLISVNTEFKCREKRLAYWNFGLPLWFGWFLGILINYSTFSFYFMIVSVAICVIYMGTIRIWMNCSTGEKPVEETVREIHAECEAMTNRSPGASFRLVTSPLLTKSFRIYPINHIEVNISPFGMGEQGKLNDGMKQNEPSYSTDDSRPVAPTTSAVTSDYQQLDVV